MHLISVIHKKLIWPISAELFKTELSMCLFHHAQKQNIKTEAELVSISIYFDFDFDSDSDFGFSEANRMVCFSVRIGNEQPLNVLVKEEYSRKGIIIYIGC